MFHNVPKDIFVDPEILMGHNVAEGGNLAPFNGGEYVSRVLRNMLGCFSDDFEISQDRIVGSLVSEKLFSGNTGGKAHNLFRRLATCLSGRERLYATRRESCSMMERSSGRIP